MDKEKLKKIARLAMFGVAGEKEAAKCILREHGMTANDLLSEDEGGKLIRVSIGYGTKEERVLIVQNYCRTFNVDEIHYWKGRRNITVEISEEYARPFVESCERLKLAWRKQVGLLLDGFIQKNRLFSNLPAVDGHCGLSPEEIREIMAMADAIKAVSLDDDDAPPLLKA